MYGRKMMAAASARLGRLSPAKSRFSGAYRSHEAALAAIPPGILAGYKHTVVTLEKFDTGVALVPYQIRNRTNFLASLEALGYLTLDQ